MMLRRTMVRCAQEVRQPRIKFPDRKAGGNESHIPHPHPAAPQEVAKNFDHFQEVFASGPHFHPEKVQKLSSSSGGGSGSGGVGGSKAGAKGYDVVDDLHDLPKRFWSTPAMVVEETEMEAIMSGGATLVQGA